MSLSYREFIECRSDFFVYRRVYRIESPISSISIFSKPMISLSFAENSKNSPKILKILGVEQNMKHRDPVNSITSWNVSATLLCIQFNSPFFAINSLNESLSPCIRKKNSLSGYPVYLKYKCKDEGRNAGVTRIFCQHVVIENRNLKSVYSILNFTF